jgi:1-deoxy-D-xylulose-5-phosphate reductoisomerase
MWAALRHTGAMRQVTILGSTGSIGTQAIDVIRANPDMFEVVALAAGGANVELLADQVMATSARAVAVADEAAAPALARALTERAEATGRPMPQLGAGPVAVADLARTPTDVVLNAITGSVGLAATLATLEAGHILALANKESLVAGGPLVRAAARPGQIVPVDSEHSALAQCLVGGRPSEVERLILTASGGPFRGWSRQQMADVTPEQALAHPTWAMGPMVTLNSATLMNKGLELIEAHLLFDVPVERIAVTVHPQSIVHSMVEFVDGSTLAQLSPPDMRLPIALALDYPTRVPRAARGLDLTAAMSLTFEPVDSDAFPALDLARSAAVAGGSAPAVLNAANEVAAAAFLSGQLRLPEICDVVTDVLDVHEVRNLLAPSDIVTVETWARERAALLVSERGTRTC